MATSKTMHLLRRLALALVAPVLLLHPWSASAGESFDKGSCTFNGHKLYGDIRVVSSGADVTVREVTSGADLNVKKVTSGASSCGEWRMVTSGADTTVRFVSSGADVSIRYVTSSPGAN